MDSDFFERVYQVVRQVPPGRVTTYGAIASFLGGRAAARTVGWAMNAAHSRFDVPAHRVVNRVGVLTGKHHFGGTNRMEDLLLQEGIPVENDKIRNFAEIFWDPADHLGDHEGLV